MRSPLIYKKVSYKYVLVEEFHIQTPLRLDRAVGNDYVMLLPSGMMIFTENYAWNGPNFPAIHTEKSILGSLPHDGGYQLIEEGLISDSCRSYFDLLLGDLVAEPCRNNFFLSALRRIRGQAYFIATDLFGSKYIKPKSQIFTIY